MIHLKRYVKIFILIIFGVASVHAREYNVEVGEFNRLNIIDNVKIIYHHDPHNSGKATFECPDSLADAIMFANNGKGTLKIEISPDFIGKFELLPTINVYSEFLTSVETSSQYEVEIASVQKSPSFKAVLFGNGNLKLNNIVTNKLVLKLLTGRGNIIATGKCPDTVVTLAGVGNINIDEMETEKVSCHLAGGGKIYCRPINELILKGIGTTSVYYMGEPKKIKKQGIGKLIHVED